MIAIYILLLRMSYKTILSLISDKSTIRKIYNMNNITFTYPSSPLLTQTNDINPDMICDTANKPKRCLNKDKCECVYIEHIPLDSTVELILIDQGGDPEGNIFHLHGYKFYVVGHGTLDSNKSLEEIKELDENGSLLKRNLGGPVLKDTVRVPKDGVVALRFKANNPGFWILRDENSNGWSRGMDVVFKVGGQCDMVQAPSSFPQCGSWVGPDFFLS